MVLPPPDVEIKLKIKQEIRNIEVPKNKQFVVYKRSYPFNNKNFFPKLTDLVDFSPRVKVIIMTRYFQENVLSILRRGFEKDTNIAISRIAQGYDILTQQILSNPELNVMEIKYDNIIDENQKTKILLQICSFLEIKPGNLENLSKIIKLPTTHIQLDNSDKNNNSYSYIPSNHFYRRKLRASEVKDNILVQVNPVKRKVETNNRLIFCINSGRCGSNYLAELLGTAEEVISHHEANPTITGKYLKAINEKSYDKSFSERWIKVEELQKSLNNLSAGEIYIDTSHVFIKTFFDVVVEEFKDNVEVIILRRNLVSVLKSFIELGYFSGKNCHWPDWMSSPNAKTAAIKCIGKDEELDQYDLCIAYLIDMETRALRFQKDYPWVKTYEVYLENLKDYDLVEKLFADLGITPTAKTKEIYAIPVNQKKDRKKKFNVGQVSLEYCNQRIAMYIEKAKSMGIEIPKTLAWNAIPTSKKDENIIQGKIKIAHIINPAIVKESSDLYIAQPITFATMKTAQQQAEGKVDVNIYTAQYPEDHTIIPEGFIKTPDLDRSILDFAESQIPRKLPLLKDILDRLYQVAVDADYLIYTNADIALQPHFYTEVGKIIEEGYDIFVINRRTIPEHYKDISEIPQMYAEKGEPHPGSDCFVFRRSLYEKFYLGNHVLGTEFVAKPMLLNCLCNAEKFGRFTDLYLTFHIGDPRTWKDNSQLEGYTNHNKGEAQKVFDYYLNQKLLPNHPLIEERFSQFMNAEPLTDTAFKAEIIAPETLVAAPGEKVEIQVTVKNISREVWPTGYISQIKLGSCWLDENVEKIKEYQSRTVLPQLLQPTESIDLPLTITIPETLNNYLLELDMLQEGVTWFGQKGSETTRVKVEVNSASKISSPPPELTTNASWEDYYELAEKFAQQKELNSAITAYQKVIEINPKHSWSYHKLANIFREQNKDDQAVTTYNQAIEINPNFSWSHYHLATILEKQGKLEEAIASYQKAIELYPNYSVFCYKLENLLKHR